MARFSHIAGHGWQLSDFRNLCAFRGREPGWQHRDCGQCRGQSADHCAFRCRRGRSGFHRRTGFRIARIANRHGRAECAIQSCRHARGILHGNGQPQLRHDAGYDSHAHLQLIEFFGAGRRQRDTDSDGYCRNDRSRDRGVSRSLSARSDAAGVDGDVAGHGMAATTKPKAAAICGCTRNGTGIGVDGGLRWRRFVFLLPHDDGNARWNLHSDDYSDLRQLDPQHDDDGSGPIEAF